MVPTTGGREKSTLHSLPWFAFFGGSPDRPEAISWDFLASQTIYNCGAILGVTVSARVQAEPWMNHRTPSMDEQKTRSSRKESRHVDTFRFTLRTSLAGTLNSTFQSNYICTCKLQSKKTCHKTCWLQVPPWQAFKQRPWPLKISPKTKDLKKWGARTLTFSPRG